MDDKQQSIVEAAEKLLERAKKGKVQALLVADLSTEDELFHSKIGSSVEMLGMMQLLQKDIEESIEQKRNINALIDALGGE